MPAYCVHCLLGRHSPYTPIDFGTHALTILHGKDHHGVYCAQFLCYGGRISVRKHIIKLS